MKNQKHKPKDNMSNYIITSEPKEEFNASGESLGMSSKLAVFYSPLIGGRQRYYRQVMSNPSKGLKLLTFKTEKAAQKVCDTTNNVSGGGWTVEELKSDVEEKLEEILLALNVGRMTVKVSKRKILRLFDTVERKQFVCYKCDCKTTNKFEICDKCNTGWSK